MESSAGPPRAQRVAALAALVDVCPALGKPRRYECNHSRALVTAHRAARLAAKQLEADLHSRGVLCDAEARCTVRLAALCTTDPRCARFPFRLEVCLDERVHRSARVCEPFGEPWQQVGAVAPPTSSPCVGFRLDRIAWWWRSMRADGASPFLRGPLSRQQVGQNQQVPVAVHQFPQEKGESLSHLVRGKPLLPQEVRGTTPSMGRGRGRRSAAARSTRPPPLTPAQRAKQEALWQAHEREFAALLRQTTAPFPGQLSRSIGTCAVVGSGHDLRCGGPRGVEIDRAHDAVFRANAMQHFTPGARHSDTPPGVSRFRIEPERGGRRTTHRASCLYANTPLLPGAASSAVSGASAAGRRDPGVCIVSFNWWSQYWQHESYSNRRALCCDPPDDPAARSNYTMAALAAHVRASGLRVAFFRGLRSNEAFLDGMRQSSGGSALHTAIALCDQPVDVYGSGLLAPDGALGDKIYTHAFDEHVGRCVTLRRAAAFAGQPEAEFERRRWASKTRWRAQRVGSELLLGVLHALGIVNWRQ